MKANELMIGDLIYVFGKNENISATPHWYYRRVTSDWLVDMERREGTNKRLGEHGISIPFPQIGDTAPIPLTAEILKANWFVTDNNHTLTDSCIYHRLCGKYEDYKVTVRLLNGWAKIESFDDRWYTLLNLSIQPRYVHELQHALRLCGLNELADNFKLTEDKQ